MRKSLTVGILREARQDELRVPLSPADVQWLKSRKIATEVESSSNRIFKDSEYKKAGARIVGKIKNASLLVGVKEPNPLDIYRDKVYMIFSHTIKGLAKNMPLIKESIRKGVTLIDYERIVDLHGNRLVYFGRLAGICGTVNSLHYLGKKLEWKGIENPFSVIKPVSKYSSLKEIKNDMLRLHYRIYKKGLSKKISPFIIGITGHGHVSQGVNEILKPLNPIEIHPKDMQSFVRHQRYARNSVHKIVMLREEKFRAKDKKGFYFEEYLKSPNKFESNLDQYLTSLNILINGSYWDKRYPRLVTKKMVRRLYKRKFRLEFIGDISCDIKGSIELTYKTTGISDPTYTYDPREDRYVDSYKTEGITILARDNLPTELPKDASRDFSTLVREYVYQLAAHGVKDIANHVAIPREVRQAVIVQDKRLTSPYSYLKRRI